MEKLKQKMEVSDSDPDPIPSDILTDIFSRLPAKSIFRFRCVSKLWRSILGLPYFPELFLTKSLARPRLLFAIEVGKDLLFYSASQPQNPLDNSTLVATRYNNPPSKMRTALSELLKALCTSWSYHGRPNTNWVLTLASSGEPLWRSIPGNPNFSIPNRAFIAGEICISGVLYYIDHYIEGSCMLACFDFSFEKFSFVKIDKAMKDGTLINYKGKLGVLVKHECELVLWVLEEDAVNHKWCALLAKEPFYIVYYNIERNTFARVNIHIPGFEELHHRTVFITTSLDYVENLKPLQSVFDRFIT
ncbi:unnamed protein product [Microthlaspi erraticum]|uniref:F-box domain-containing protein n=1 Tax=Microthlaspi erraticum TaxID=1685480 RepID=A0A6D2KYP7_9BRAS|nr:unnamed protein product [Microthlaspi erraticum]